MTVTFPHRPEMWWPEGAVRCFLCGDQFRLERTPAVAWHGWSPDGECAVIFLHAECGRRLGMQLIGDGTLALVAGGGADYWTRLSRPLIAAALAAEERRR